MPEKTRRIAMIGHKSIPSRDGGVEVVVSSLAPCLAELGYDHSFFPEALTFLMVLFFRKK